MSEDPESLPEGAERIGPLLFVPHDEPPGEEFERKVRQEKPPRHWMEEQSGTLAVAVESYLNGDRLTPRHFELIKVYLHQYVERAVLTRDADRARLLRRVDQIHSLKDLEDLNESLGEYGAEPF
jgi:hypothetical protein